MGSMSAYDLRTTQPRRWNVQVDGVIWLPRLIDKARAYDAGTLGLYLYGQSPVDGALLGAARIDYAALLDAVRAAPDDDGVLREIERRAPGATQRLQTWSAKPPASCRAIFAWNDVDEGYTRGPVARVIRFVSEGIYPVLTATMRKLWPLRTK